MSNIAQFAMVEELGSLIKDNLPSKHLVLTIEAALLNYLQDDPSPDGILELEPMSSYNRLIIHRLADIFGFAHKSVGEGVDRHLVLQRCFETSVPSILVSDILWQHDSYESPSMPYQLLKRDGASTLLKMNNEIFASPSFDEKEAAYMAARERIFGTEEVELKARQKPRHVPTVARRLIAHALGQKFNHCDHVKGENSRLSNELTHVHDIERNIELNMYDETVPDSTYCLSNSVKRDIGEVTDANGSLSALDDKPSRKAPERRASGGGLRSGIRDGVDISTSMKQENMGAAKRIFAHALGKQASKNDVSGAGR